MTDCTALVVYNPNPLAQIYREARARQKARNFVMFYSTGAKEFIRQSEAFRKFMNEGDAHAPR